MSDLVSNLRSLARFEHADLSIGDEAADEIERQDREIRRLEEHRHDLLNEVERLKLAIAGGEDAPGFVLGQPIEMYEYMCDGMRRTQKEEVEAVSRISFEDGVKAGLKAAREEMRAYGWTKASTAIGEIDPATIARKER